MSVPMDSNKHWMLFNAKLLSASPGGEGTRPTSLFPRLRLLFLHPPLGCFCVPQDWREEGKEDMEGTGTVVLLTAPFWQWSSDWVRSLKLSPGHSLRFSSKFPTSLGESPSLLVAHIFPPSRPPASPHTYRQPSWIASSRTPGQLWPLAHTWTLGNILSWPVTGRG